MKYWKVLPCMMALGAMLSVAAMAEDRLETLPAEGAKAYLGTVQNLANQYGINRSCKIDEFLLSGLSCARIIDFDADGTPELYCAWGSGDNEFVQHQAIWTYTDVGVKKIFSQDVSNFGTDVSPETLLYVGSKNAYLVDGREVMNGGTVTYFTKSGDSMTKALTYTAAVGEYAGGTSSFICTLNGKPISENQLDASLEKFTAGMTEYAYFYFQDPYEGQDVKTTVSQSIELLKTVVYPTAKASLATLQIDGQRVSAQAYQMNGNNYYKLRDLAYVLNGSKKQFALTWNTEMQRIDLTLKKPYEPVGGEGYGVTGTQQASLSSANIWMNNAKLSITAYQINGNNYLKLRDLAAAMDFGVTWDEHTQCIYVDTKASYRAD